MKKLTAILIILILGMFFLPKKQQEVKRINQHSVLQHHYNNHKASRFTSWSFNN